MKLVTYSTLPSGRPRPGILLDGQKIADIGAALGESAETASLLAIVQSGPKGLEKLRAAAAKPPATTVALADA
jgi:hypothetical protein